jgi:hypothetical protein
MMSDDTAKERHDLEQPTGDRAAEALRSLASIFREEYRATANAFERFTRTMAHGQAPVGEAADPGAHARVDALDDDVVDLRQALNAALQRTDELKAAVQRDLFDVSLRLDDFDARIARLELAGRAQTAPKGEQEPCAHTWQLAEVSVGGWSVDEPKRTLGPHQRCLGCGEVRVVPGRPPRSQPDRQVPREVADGRVVLEDLRRSELRRDAGESHRG